jgi:hypothetical protein
MSGVLDNFEVYIELLFTYFFSTILALSYGSKYLIIYTYILWDFKYFYLASLVSILASNLESAQNLAVPFSVPFLIFGGFFINTR